MIVRATMVYNFDGENCVNVIHAHSAAATITAADVSEVAQVLFDWFDDWVQPQVSNELQLTRIDYRPIDSSTPAPATRTSGLPLVGGDTSGSFMTAAVVLSLYTASAGRRARGRVYVPGIPRSAMGNAYLSTTAWATWTEIGNKLKEGFDNATAPATDPWDLVVYSRADALQRDVTDVRVGRRVDTQRRRNPRNEAGYNT